MSERFFFVFLVFVSSLRLERKRTKIEKTRQNLSRGFQTARSLMNTACSRSSSPSLQAAREKAASEARARRREREEEKKEEEKEEGRKEANDDDDDDDKAAAAKTSGRSRGGRSFEASKSQAAAASEPATAAAVTAQSRRLVASRGAVFCGGGFGEKDGNEFAAAKRAKIEGGRKKTRRRLFLLPLFEIRESKTNAPAHELKKSLEGMTSTAEEEEERTKEAERARKKKRTKLVPSSFASRKRMRMKVTTGREKKFLFFSIFFSRDAVM